MNNKFVERINSHGINSYLYNYCILYNTSP